MRKTLSVSREIGFGNHHAQRHSPSYGEADGLPALDRAIAGFIFPPTREDESRRQTGQDQTSNARISTWV